MPSLLRTKKVRVLGFSALSIHRGFAPEFLLMSITATSVIDEVKFNANEKLEAQAPSLMVNLVVLTPQSQDHFFYLCLLPNKLY